MENQSVMMSAYYFDNNSQNKNEFIRRSEEYARSRT